MCLAMLRRRRLKVFENWQLAPLSWEAFATFMVGFAAYKAAVKIGMRQTDLQRQQTEILRNQIATDLDIRTQQLKLALIDKRSEVVLKVRGVLNVYSLNSRFEHGDVKIIIEAMNEASLIFPNTVEERLQSVLRSSMLSASKTRLSDNLFKRGKEKEGERVAAEAFDLEVKIHDELPSILNDLVAHTAVRI